MTTYAGIGSRATPPSMCHLFMLFAEIAAQRGWTLRSGGAVGADTAFYEGARAGNGAADIFLPDGGPLWNGRPAQGAPNIVIHTTSMKYAEDLARKYHPAWSKCSPQARRNHARNTHILLGADLLHPVDVVACWTPGASGKGGTGQGIRVAKALGIPVFDTGACEGPLEAAEMLASVLATFTKGSP